MGVSQKLQNGPGTNYWKDSQADTLANRFVKALWKEGSWCYIEYPVISGNSITGYKRGYASVPGISTSAGAKSYSPFKAYSNYIDVFYMPYLKRRIGNAAAGYEVTVIGEENGNYYIEYWSTESKVYKRGYTPKAGILNEKTVVSFIEEDKARRLYVGESFTLKPIFYPAGTKNTRLEWTSSDTNVATVDQNGKVTAKGSGTATITAKLTMNGEKATCKVNVRYYCQAEDSLYSDWDKHADLHNLELVTPSYGFPYYICRGCGNKFKTPEEQDVQILSDADKVTVFSLLQASLIKELEGKYSSMEACIRAIDKIREKYYGYDYSYHDGNYKSPYSFTYSKSSMDVSIKVSTIQFSEMSLIVEALLWNINQLLPYPFDVLSEQLKKKMSINRDYTFAEIARLSNEIILSDYTNKIFKIIREKNKYLYVGIKALNYTSAVLSTLQNGQLNAGDYCVEIDMYNDNFFDTFQGYYYIYYGKIYVLDEREFLKERNVNGTKLNIFNQSYLGITHELCFSRNDENLFD